VARFREHYARRYNLSATELDALIARRKSDQQRFSEENRSHAIDLARHCNATLASHDDATATDVERAAQSGCTITEFPTSLVAARRARTLAMHVLAGAPNLVRGGSHSGNVSASALIAEDMVDILSSDYCPSSLLQAVFCLARNATVPLHAAVATASTNPARALHLSDRGSIVEGMRADLIRVRDTRHGPIVINAWCGGRQVA
jgi:alpha-D-ribose 1-methylphosphonate 5-triphosphate diphosphatase